MVFFFSSRRRHTRLQGDWSSDVCSSDLSVPPMQVGGETDVVQVLALVEGVDTRVAPHQLLQLVLKHGALKELNGKPAEIGRASCREKSVDLGGRRIIKKKKLKVTRGGAP